MASYSDVLFGRIVLKNRLATHAQISECLDDGAPGQTLGEIMVERGYLSPHKAGKVQRAQALMQFMRAERAFARIVVDRRLVDLQTLRKCFEFQEQNQHRMRLAQILVERRLITLEQCEAIVDDQLMQLAEETARIEEEGLAQAGKSQRRKRPVDELSNIHKIEDLEDSTMKRAVGPKGLIDNAPSREAVRRTLPMMKAAQIDDAPKHTLIMPGGTPQGAPPAPAGANGTDELVGKTIASRYRILSKVGEGGMGTVYKAEHCLMEKIVALKVLHASLLSSKASLDRFRLEIRAASRFQHKNVIQIYDAGEGEGGLFYMAMEFAQGETLEEILQRRGALPTAECLSYFNQALTAVGEAHKKGIVHRDLKSGNLMIVQDPKTGEQLVKVMDFGIAKFAFDESDHAPQPGGLYRTQEGIVTGTPQYMSPEQASGEEVDYRSDLYSLGVIMFELLTGELPFKSNTPMGFLGKHIVEPPPRPGLVKPGIPMVLEEVTLKLLEKRPADRYQSAEAVLADLQSRCSGEGLSVVSTADTQVGRHVPEFARPKAPPARAPAGPRAVTPAPQRTVAIMPQPDVERAPTRQQKERKPAVVLGGLLVLLLLVITGSTTLVLAFKDQKAGTGGGGEAASVAATSEKARALMKARDFVGAVKLLEAVKPPTPAITKLLEQARKGEAELEEAARLAQNADRLAADFANGEAGREAAEEAVREYELSLELNEDAKVRERLVAVRERLENKSKPPDQAKQGLTLVIEANQALQSGRLEDAERSYGHAKTLLTAGHRAVIRLGDQIQAERLLIKAKADRAAGHLDAAKAALTKAAGRELDAERLERVNAALAAVRGEITKRERTSAIQGLLDKALAAGVRLDLEEAKGALSQAQKTAEELKLDEPVIAQRSAALATLTPFADRLLSASDELDQLEKNPKTAVKGQAERLLSGLRSLRDDVATLEKDPPLKARLGERLQGWITRANALITKLESLREVLKSEKLKRFERQLGKLRKAEEKAEAMTMAASKASELKRLNELLYLQEHPSYVHRECSAEDRAWLIERAKAYTKRRKVWSDLKPDDAKRAPEMVAIRGGRWKHPGGKEYDLPKVYYLATTEVTCVEWQRYMRATGAKRPTAFPGPTDEPVRFISLADARGYCRWRSKRSDGTKRRVVFRVPTEMEWERAARGPDGTRFPWGETFEDWRERYAAVSGRIAKVGVFPKDENAWGLKDMVGNVSEMTTLVGNPKQVVLRGGSAVSERSMTGFDFRKELKIQNVASGYTGLRILAVER